MRTQKTLNGLIARGGDKQEECIGVPPPPPKCVQPDKHDFDVHPRCNMLGPIVYRLSQGEPAPLAPTSIQIRDRLRARAT